MNPITRLLAWLDLDFMETLDDGTLAGDELAKRREQHLATARAMTEANRKAYLEMVRRWYAEQESTRNSVTSRASSLMLFVGVIGTGTTLLAGGIGTAPDGLRAAMLLVGAALLYSCLAIAFGAVRSQGVRRFTMPFLTPKATLDAGKTLDSEEAADYAIALEQNKKILATLVAYLAYAHKWALRAVFLVTLLAGLSVWAAALKPPAAAAPTPAPAVAPAPSASPTLPPSAPPTTTPTTPAVTIRPPASSPTSTTPVPSAT